MPNYQQSSNPIQIFVIICHGRSGSTLFRLLLDTHSQIYAPAEPWLFLWYYQSLQSDNIANKAYNQFLGDDKVAAHKDFIHSVIRRKLSKNKKSIFVEKTPRNREILDFIDRVDKNIRYIHLVRDLRAVACWRLYRGNTVQSVWKNRLTGVFFKNLKQIKKSQSEINVFINNLDKNRLFILRYEDLVLDTEKVLTLLFDWMKVEYEDVTSYKKNEGLLGDINAMQHDRIHSLSVDKWKRKLLWLEKKCFDRYLGKINREVLSKKTSCSV